MNIQAEFAFNFEEKEILDKTIVLDNKQNYDSMNTQLQIFRDACGVGFPTRHIYDN